MRIHWLSVKTWAANTIGSIGLVILDACSWPTVDQPPAEPTPPTVPDMPRQRDTAGQCPVSEADKAAMVRFKAAMDLGIEPDPADVALVDEITKRAEVALLQAIWLLPSAEVAND